MVVPPMQSYDAASFVAMDLCDVAFAKMAMPGSCLAAARAWWRAIKVDYDPGLPPIFVLVVAWMRARACALGFCRRMLFSINHCGHACDNDLPRV